MFSICCHKEAFWFLNEFILFCVGVDHRLYINILYPVCGLDLNVTLAPSSEQLLILQLQLKMQIYMQIFDHKENYRLKMYRYKAEKHVTAGCISVLN